MSKIDPGAFAQTKTYADNITYTYMNVKTCDFTAFNFKRALIPPDADNIQLVGPQSNLKNCDQYGNLRITEYVKPAQCLLRHLADRNFFVRLRECRYTTDCTNAASKYNGILVADYRRPRSPQLYNVG